jgi:hypothetical protein
VTRLERERARVEVNSAVETYFVWECDVCGQRFDDEDEIEQLWRDPSGKVSPSSVALRDRILATACPGDEAAFRPFDERGAPVLHRLEVHADGRRHVCVYCFGDQPGSDE